MLTVYAWVGAADKGRLQDRSGVLIIAIRLELCMRSDHSVILSIDSNGDFGDFGLLVEATGNGNLWSTGDAPYWDSVRRGLPRSYISPMLIL